MTACFPFDNIRFRLGPRGRDCDGEGNGNSTRYVLASHSQTDCSAATREVGRFEIQRPGIPGSVFREVRQWGKEDVFGFEQ